MSNHNVSDIKNTINTINNNSSEAKNQSMVYKSCDLIEHGFVVDNQNCIRVCSIINNEYLGQPLLFSNYTGEILDKETFFTAKRKYREMTRNGSYPYECTNCPRLLEKAWDNDDYIDNILLSHWIDCNSRCIYCSAPTDETLKKINKYYNFTPAIKEMIDNGSIIRSAKIDFAGGEPTVYPEFESLLSLFLKEGFHNIFINTSGIKYSKSIRTALRNNQINTLTISLDAGSKEMHKKVKQVNSYDKVWENIYRYSEAQQEAKTKEKICLKYILLPNINTKKEEIDLFLEKVANAKIDYVALSLDMFWWTKHKDDDNKSLINISNYFIEETQKYKFKKYIYPWARWLLGIKEIVV
ncbi:radical SAM protein [bacterium]|nr:radical SAM protein [bacterium]